MVCCGLFLLVVFGWSFLAEGLTIPQWTILCGRLGSRTPQLAVTGDPDVAIGLHAKVHTECSIDTKRSHWKFVLIVVSSQFSTLSLPVDTCGNVVLSCPCRD